MNSKQEVIDSIADDSHKELDSINYDIRKEDKNLSKPQDAKTKKTITLCKIVVLSVAIGLAWILLLLAIIFYHLPDETYTRQVSEGS